LNLLNPVHTLLYYLFDICLNNILPSKVRFLECSLSFRCCHYNSVCTSSCLPCVPHLPPISTFSDMIPLTIFALAYKSCVSSLCNCLSPPCYFLPLTCPYFHHPVLEHTPCGRPGFAFKRYQSNYVFFILRFWIALFFLIRVAQVSKFRNINLCIPKVHCPATNNPRLNAVLIHITPHSHTLFPWYPF
jgi:hypothetical protein